MNECASDDDCLDQGGMFQNQFCTLNVSPTRCASAPSCTSDAQCVHLNLLCDLSGGPSNGYCQNGMPCPNGNECNPTTEVCDPQSQVCVRKNCINTPSLCMATETCDVVTGQCTPSQTGTCADDIECPAGRYCDLATTPGTCKVGCRSSADCAGGNCDVNHQCQAPTGSVCGPCTTDADCPAGTQCVESLMTCYEPCSTILMLPCTINPAATCVFGNCTCFL
jgi:hypothetical protein